MPAGRPRSRAANDAAKEPGHSRTPANRHDPHRHGFRLASRRLNHLVNHWSTLAGQIRRGSHAGSHPDELLRMLRTRMDNRGRCVLGHGLIRTAPDAGTGIYGSEGWQFESLRARQARGPYPNRPAGAFFAPMGATARRIARDRPVRGPAAGDYAGAGAARSGAGSRPGPIQPAHRPRQPRMAGYVRHCPRRVIHSAREWAGHPASGPFPDNRRPDRVACDAG